MQQEKPIDFSRDPSAIKILESIKSIQERLHQLVDDCRNGCIQEPKSQ